MAKLGSVCRRIYRIFSHAYFHHRQIFDTYEVSRQFFSDILNLSVLLISLYSGKKPKTMVMTHEASRVQTVQGHHVERHSLAWSVGGILRQYLVKAGECNMLRIHCVE